MSIATDIRSSTGAKQWQTWLADKGKEGKTTLLWQFAGGTSPSKVPPGRPIQYRQRPKCRPRKCRGWSTMMPVTDRVGAYIARAVRHCIFLCITTEGEVPGEFHLEGLNGMESIVPGATASCLGKVPSRQDLGGNHRPAKCQGKEPRVDNLDP